MIDLPVRHFTGAGGVRLAYRELGQGRPLVLIHGYFSTAAVNWIRYGHAEKIAAQGFQVIMPDLRGHGDSDRPHDPAAYPPDVLADDGFALLDHLGLTDYDLAGYSLGGRTAIRMLARGATPRRAVIAGMGLAGITRTGHRSDHFRRILTRLGTFERGTPEWKAEAFLKTVGGDPQALLGVLETFVDTPEETLAFIDTPILVLTGALDDDNGSAAALADTLPDARYTQIPGDHMSAVTRPELATELLAFLTA
ncbi:alpha/beta fold hydrolase [Actinocorallia lasiicapitis]